MREARIECLVREFPVHDLGLRLRKGQVEFVPEADAKGSKDLAHARGLGAVRVRFIERSRVSKQPPKNPPPPNVRLPKKQVRGPVVVPATPETATVDMDEVRRVAREAAEEGTAKGVEEGLRRALDGFVGQPANAVTMDNLKDALAEVLGGLNLNAAPAPRSGGAPAPSRATGPEEPVFIPKDIVAKDGKTDLSVSSESSDAGDLDAAAAALKAAKPARRQTKRSTKEQ